jgi:beta-RFAP synthase
MSAKVSVTAAARLHLGFFDMNGGLGRKFGGIGLAIDRPLTRLTLTRAEGGPAARVEGPEAERATRLLAAAQATLAPNGRYALTIHEAIPAHAGLGSGTQLAIAIAAALRRFEDLPDDPSSDAAMLARGARSGLGAGLFAHGGLIVDGGRGPHTLTPPVIARTAFPERWRVILVSDTTAEGLHGMAEKDAFAALPPLGEEATGELCRRVLMQALPALAETDIAAFGAAIARIQEIVGDYFAPAQGGRRFASAQVGRIVGSLVASGAVGGGQTSWGPTGFVFVESETAAQALVDRLDETARAAGVRLSIHRGLNHGARIDAAYARVA